MEKQSPVQRIWELGKDEHGKLITAVILAVVGVVCGILLYLCVVSAMEKKSALIAENTQKSQTDLIEAVLETVQGMSVVKSFNPRARATKSSRTRWRPTARQISRSRAS